MGSGEQFQGRCGPSGDLRDRPHGDMNRERLPDRRGPPGMDRGPPSGMPQQRDYGGDRRPEMYPGDRRPQGMGMGGRPGERVHPGDRHPHQRPQDSRPNMNGPPRGQFDRVPPPDRSYGDNRGPNPYQGGRAVDNREMRSDRGPQQGSMRQGDRRNDMSRYGDNRNRDERRPDSRGRGGDDSRRGGRR